MLLHEKDSIETIKPYDILPWNKIKNIKSTTVGPNFNIEEVGYRMLKTCLIEDGIGLAAPQFGLFKRIILCRVFDGDGNDYRFKSEFKLYLNPSFDVTDNSVTIETERCLSVPKTSFKIKRPKKIEISWDEIQDGKMLQKKDILEGWSARLFLHEADHLNGISIPQRWKIQNKK